MPRPRPSAQAHGLPPEDYRPPSPAMLPKPMLRKLWLADDESLQDDRADRGEEASVEADEDTSASTKKQGGPMASAHERILKILTGELDTRLSSQNEDLVASMSLQLQEVKQAIMTKLDWQELQIGAVQEDLAHAREHCMSPALRDDVEDAPMLERSLPEALRQQTTPDTRPPSVGEHQEGSSPTPVSESEEKLDSGGVEQKPDPESMHEVWKRGASPQDLEAADEVLRRASFEFSTQQRSSSFHDEEPAKPPPPMLHQIAHGTTFESISMVVIMTNAIFVGMQTELATTAGSDEQDSPAVFAINTAYTLFFSVELALRVLASGRGFFLDRSAWQWNLLDAFTVLTSILECGMELAMRIGSRSGQIQGVSQIRVLRMLRLVRLLRGLKIARTIKSIRAFRTLVQQILFTVNSILWAMFLSLIIIYLFAVSFTQAANMHRIDMGLNSFELEQHGDVRLHKYWSSLPRSMFTLFLSITGGVSWEEAVYPLGDVGAAWVVMFLMYICFAQMAVLNVITGYFCQSAVEGATLDPDLVTAKALASKQMYIGRLAEIFGEIDIDRSGFITLHEFEEHLQDEYTKAYFDSLGIDGSDVWTLFKLMDADTGHQIDLEEFTTGCMRLSGGAKSLDLAKLAYDHTYMVKTLGKFIARTDHTLLQLTDAQMRSAGAIAEGRGARS